jgi:hypothetical protein
MDSLYIHLLKHHAEPDQDIQQSKSPNARSGSLKSTPASLIGRSSNPAKSSTPSLGSSSVVVPHHSGNHPVVSIVPPPGIPPVHVNSAQVNQGTHSSRLSTPTVLDLCLRVDRLKHLKKLREMDFDSTWRDECLLSNLNRSYLEQNNDRMPTVFRFAVRLNESLRVKQLTAVILSKVCAS